MGNDEKLNILRRGRERVSRGWCKSALALNAKGQGREPDDPQAVRWCALGALGNTVNEASFALYAALPNGGTSIADYNNAPTTTQADVVALFDRAIAKLAPKRTDSELVADLMARIGQQTIPDGEIASPEYARA